MHDDHEPGHEPGYEPSHESAHEPQPRPLPTSLRNWQVIEIDGEATAVVDGPQLATQSTDQLAAQPAGRQANQPEEEGGDLQISDRQDDVIVAALDHRRRQVECGATVEFAVNVLNNGPQAALFQVQVEGWLEPSWVGDAGNTVLVEPGARATLRVPLAPPRQAASEAGDYHFAVSVRSPQHPNRLARLGAMLTVLPFDAVEAHFLEMAEVVVSWRKRSATLPLAVTNRGNRPAEMELHEAGVIGTSAPHACRVTFGAPTIRLQPNQTVTVGVRAEVQRPPWLALQGREVPVQVEVRAAENIRDQAATSVTCRPLIGPWQIVTATGLAAASAFGFLLLVSLFFLLARQPDPTPAAAGPPAPAPVAAPPVIIVNLNQPAGAAPPAAGPAPLPNGPGAIVSSFTSGDAPDPSLPLVLPDQVSAPNGAAPAVAPAVAAASSGLGAPGTALSFRPVAANPASSSAPAAPSLSTGATGSNQTYGQMFEEVGRRFDMDWRMLAAQAYIESGFDSLALSDSGAMGLMQVLPDTWREWATAVEVSDPFDAYSSVLVAAAYLDYLRSQLAAQGYPDKQWMLVAYNWGPDKLNSFLVNGGTWDTLPEVRRQYASEILRIAGTIP